MFGNNKCQTFDLDNCQGSWPFFAPIEECEKVCHEWHLDIEFENLEHFIRLLYRGHMHDEGNRRQQAHILAAEVAKIFVSEGNRALWIANVLFKAHELYERHGDATWSIKLPGTPIAKAFVRQTVGDVF